MSTTAPTPVLSPNARLIAQRFSFGLKPRLAKDIVEAGNGRSWFVLQLAPRSLADPGGDDVDTWFGFRQRSTEEIFERQKNGTQNVLHVMNHLSQYTVARRLRSSRQVQEVMVDFWSNLLHVPLRSGKATFARADYDKTIRTYALSSFEQLLQHAIVHPAMGINLDNFNSTKKAPNENLGRELLELHTVGLGYTEADVTSSARILTGYRVTFSGQFRAYYDPGSHWTGPVSSMGFTSDNPDPDGQAVTMAYLSHLARHPMTAERIARRLCVKFVRDDPTDAIVEAVRAAYVANGTAIKPTLLALVDHPDFKASTGLKLRTPQEDWQATVRALGIKVLRPTREASFATAMYSQYKSLGAAPYEWAAPNGYPEVNTAWAGGGRMLHSFGSHARMVAQTRYPYPDAVMPDLAAMVPPAPATLQAMVNAYALRLLGQPPTPQVSQAVSALLGHPLSHVVSRQEADLRWTRIGIVTTLLDSPQHLYR